MFPQWGQIPVQKSDDQFSYPPLMSNGQPWPKLEFGFEQRGELLVIDTGSKKFDVVVGWYFDRKEMIAKRPSHIHSVDARSLEYAACELFPEEKVENSKAFLMTRIKEMYESEEGCAVRFE